MKLIAKTNFYLFLYFVFCSSIERRVRFEEEFQSTCSKFPFVKKFLDKIEYPGDKYTVFVYQESRYKNGGLGDRIGGLINAAAISLRFNRTILIKSENGVGDLFRPYHPVDIKSDNPKYSWNDWKSWTNYNYSYEYNDNTEYDLYDCINTPSQKNGHCGMDGGDVPQPIIKIRSNRAYLCRWDNMPDSISHKELLELIGTNNSEEVDLFEVAGCLMRLVLWPTEKLWDEVDKIYDNFNNRYENDHLNNVDWLKDASALHHSKPMFQIGLHFRCGDRSYISHGGFDEACVHDENSDAERSETGHMVYGSPVEIAECTKKVLLKYGEAFFKKHHHHLVNKDVTTDILIDNVLMEYEKLNKDNENNNNYHNNNRLNISSLLNESFMQSSMLVIASDNDKSSMQMQRISQHPHALISPQGCHIEMDASSECQTLTVSYWFLLSLSDVIVTHGSVNPISAFSRYAAIYGFRYEKLRLAKSCEVNYYTLKTARNMQGNWFC